MQKINLNLIPGGVCPVVNVSQYDEGRQFQLAIFQGAASYDLTGKTVTIEVGKTDGNGCAYGASDTVNGVPVVDFTGNVVTITTPIQMTACAGDNKAELKISDATAEVGTLNFILLCEPSALSPDTPISDTDIPAIIDAAEENADRAEAAVAHYPYINTVNKNWMVWDSETGTFVDTGIRAEGIDGEGSVQSVNGVLPDVGGNVMLSLASITHDPLLTANGGTGNPFGYIQTGLKSGETAGLQSTAEGKDNKAGMYAHAEGWDNNASGQDSHAEGYSNTASGLHSHAEGIETTASAQGTHAGGCGTVAGYSYQTAIGKYNSNQSDTLFEVGNGASNNSRSNAIAVKTDGRITKGANNAFASAANIADVIEMTRTMTALRAKGTHVYVVADDLTYEVTADAGIASSGTLIPNTNAVVWTAAGGYEKLNSDLASMNEVVQISANGTETYGQLLFRALRDYIVLSKVTPKATLHITGLQTVVHIVNILSNGLVMGCGYVSNSLPATICVTILTNGTGIVNSYSNNTYNDYSTITATGRIDFRYQ